MMFISVFTKALIFTVWTLVQLAAFTGMVGFNVNSQSTPLLGRIPTLLTGEPPAEMIRLDVFGHVGRISEASIAEITLQPQPLVESQLVLIKPEFSFNFLPTLVTFNKLTFRVLKMPFQAVVI